MSATKILWGQVFLVTSIVALSVWAATQWTAASLGFQPQLGAPVANLAGQLIYQPPAFFWWWFAYDAYAPRVFVQGAYIAWSTPGQHRDPKSLDSYGMVWSTKSNKVNVM